MLSHALSLSGHPTISDLAPTVYKAWTDAVTKAVTDDANLSPCHLVPLAGLTAMAGSQNLWLQVNWGGNFHLVGGISWGLGATIDFTKTAHVFQYLVDVVVERVAFYDDDITVFVLHYNPW